jgi:hypothetical protein
VCGDIDFFTELIVKRIHDDKEANHDECKRRGE